MKVRDLLDILDNFNPDLEIEIEVKDELWNTEDVEIDEVFYNHPENKRLLINLTPPPEEEIEEKETRPDVVGMDFETALERFMEIAQAGVDTYMSRFPGQWKRLSMERGRRYIRIVAESGMEHRSYISGEVSIQRSAWGFIDMTNGDILKAASWKAPAKHARGNIFNVEYELTPHGPPYLK